MSTNKRDLKGKRYKSFAANDAYNAQPIENGSNVWEVYSDTELYDLYNYHADKGNTLATDIAREIKRRESEEK